MSNVVDFGSDIVRRAGRRSLSLWSFALLATGLMAMPLPDLPSVARPNPEPSAPVGWDTFAPTVSPEAPSSVAPTIAEWTRSGEPDDSLILTGDKFSNFSSESQGKDTQFVIYGQTTPTNGAQLDGAIRRLDGGKAAVTLPATLPPASLYLLWPRNSVGFGSPVAVNRTEAWWLGFDNQVARGDTVSIYGRNLANSSGAASSWVYVKPAGVAAGQWISPSSVNPYRVQFIVPAHLGNGKYEVWIHNGHGGSYGWSGPLPLTITDPYQWNGDTFSVKDSAYGAKGDGATDDSDAIRSAFRAACDYRNRTGLHPTLYFPSGTYLIRYGIPFFSDLRYLGAGKDLTIIKCNPQFTHPMVTQDGGKDGIISSPGGSQHNIEVKDLTLDANYNFGGTNNGNCLVLCAWGDTSPDIKLTNLRLRMLVADNSLGCAFINNAKRLSISGCEFVGSYLFLLHVNQCSVTDCTFLGANDSQTALFIWGSNNIAVSNCSLKDYDSSSLTGQGQGRFLTGNGAYGTQQNIYIGDNTTVQSAPRAGFGDGNTGEQIMCEGNDTRYTGHPTSATLSTVTLSDLNISNDFILGQTAVIVDGRGLGQYRQISGYDAGTKTISVSPAWNVAPDSRSTLLIAHAALRWVAYNNDFDGKSDYASRSTGSTAIEIYGGCYDWVVDRNNITHMRHAIYDIGLDQQWKASDPARPLSINPSYFNIFTNNRIQSCYDGLFVGSGNPSSASSMGINLLGNVFRNNSVSDIATTGVNVTLWPGTKVTPAALVDLTLFEHNLFSRVQDGADLDFYGTAKGQITNLIFYDNAFSALSSDSYGMIIGEGDQVAVNANTWSGFPTTYAGTPPGAILEIPIRNFSVQGSAGGYANTASALILNSGTSPLNWNASSDSPWLTFSAVKGTVADERQRSVLSIICSPTYLQPGSYAGTITITASTQTKKIGVAFNVSAGAASGTTSSPSVRQPLPLPAGNQSTLPPKKSPGVTPN